MYSKEDKELGPPKGVPQVLYDQVATLRWIRSVVGESKSWPSGPLVNSFLENVNLLLQGQPLPSLTEVENLKKKLSDSEDEIKDLQLQIRSSPTQQIAPEVEYRALPCGFWKHPKVCLVLLLLGFVVGLLVRK